MAVSAVTTDEGRRTTADRRLHTMWDVVEQVYARFVWHHQIEDEFSLNQLGLIRTMMIEAAAQAAGEAWRDRATVLNVQPGDVLIAHVSEPMPFEAVDRLRQSLLIHLRPFGLHDVIVLNAVDSLTVVRKGEGNA